MVLKILKEMLHHQSERFMPYVELTILRLLEFEKDTDKEVRVCVCVCMCNVPSECVTPCQSVGQVWYGMVWYGMVWYGIVEFNVPLDTV